MFVTKPARRISETEGVIPTYNFSDVKYVRKSIIDFVTAVNSSREDHEPKLNMEAIVRTAMKRIAKHNGYTSKYTGSGELRENTY
ncbi:MAG: hypothetical protein Tp1111DCM1126091_127 [Prokaryotic dsDNA virus sp.]|nr:MAG: hypothetical protein Tp1111DCM1126091_127 [Prokaryotic dsDNA virus sp.]|tara:strand:+ start:23636 stop:23890 length:255 start_codon:yes stop_codon:yes gene_type:complete